MHTYMRDAYIYAAGPNPRHYTYRSHLPCEFSQVSGHVGGPITSRLLAVPGTRPPAISTRKRAFDSCSTSFLVAVLILAKRGSLYCGFCPPPLCLFNKLERNDENRANFQDHRRTFELFKCGILAAPLILHLGFLGRLERV